MNMCCNTNCGMSLIHMITDLVSLIHKEEMLRKHHRAYLHVRDEIMVSCDTIMSFISSFNEKEIAMRKSDVDNCINNKKDSANLPCEVIIHMPSEFQIVETLINLAASLKLLEGYEPDEYFSD